jgi:two-component system, OmpR family, alkaline phosphatase synthesis response regulator PhoP
MAQRRVLVIDDEPDIREVVQMCLEEMANWIVFTADSGVAGVHLAGEKQPSVILLDVMMPGQDGPTTFAQLQESKTTQSIPVIFMTAKAQPAEQRRFKDLGAAGVIPKPFNPLELAEQIDQILDALERA